MASAPTSRSASFWLITLAAVVGVVAGLRLGHWQLTRAWEKEAMEAALAQTSTLAALDNTALLKLADKSSAIHQPVKLRGSWDAAHTVFLDNRQMDAKPGFYVVTPLRLPESGASILVQRGWVPRNFQDRSSLPTVQTATGAVEIEGRIAPPPAKLHDLGSDVRGPIRQNLDLAAFGRETGLALLPVSVVLSVGNRDGSQDGLLRHWPQPALGAGKNYGYAFQWFALSALIAFLYVWFQFGQGNVAQRES